MDFRVVRDGYGVPHVRGETEAAAWFGMGYACAQDRMFQMDYDRRRSCGRWADWRGFLRPGAAVVLGSALLSALEPTLPVDLEARLGAGASLVGALFALAALAYGACSPLAGRAADRWGGRRVMAIGAAACAATLPLLAVPATWPGEAATLAAAPRQSSFCRVD